MPELSGIAATIFDKTGFGMEPRFLEHDAEMDYPSMEENTLVRISTLRKFCWEFAGLNQMLLKPLRNPLHVYTASCREHSFKIFF